MTIKVALEHVTAYEFDRAINIGPHVVRLRPAPHCRTPIEAYSLRIDPADRYLNWQQDPFGNFEARLVFPEKSTRLEVTVDLIVDMTVINPFDFFLDEDVEELPWSYSKERLDDLAPYLKSPPGGDLLDEFVAAVDTTPRRTIEFLVDINQQVASDVKYTIRMEPGVQTPEQTLDRGIGSCRDSAWLLVAALRRLGYASRFVSGYLVQLAPDEKPLDGPGGPDTDFTDLHAWCEVFLPGAGWVGLDPTSALFAGEGHIPLAATPTPSTAAPISGVTDECEVEFSFHNRVRRIHEDPRVTKPYSEQQWERVQTTAAQIDERLRIGDVRLTMGGEPTFVSVDDMDGAEWDTEADGPTKRRLAAELVERLHDRFAPDGVVHHGQGKWYPGEPLPRWQHQITWRTDGLPLWRDRSLLADPSTPGDKVVDDAAVFATSLAKRLGFGTSTLTAGWEDPIHQLWEEANQPTGEPPDELDPEDERLASETGRRSITAELDRRANQATGWVLPLFRAEDGSERWATVKWRTRRSHLFLLPGDSPMGYRLPIQSLSWTAPLPAFEPSRFAELRPFQADPRATGAADGVVIEGEAPPTALCAEVRDGRLHIFLPPIEDADHAVDLLGHLEAVAEDTDLSVVLEGYPLPGDPRFRSLSVTPDPGVIEVNVPPASDWGELTEIVEAVYEDARQTRLGTEKFDLDGHHTGTGGGNHITLGGFSPEHSPLLRRPDLLRSLIAYWQHHPALSYLFSGRFIGPSSQSPRVDEARDDNLYELETAFGLIDAMGSDISPWTVDRALRNLLVDLTGNTHRAEFCIDKLFSPEGERGRLGLLELRAFEMPPHPRMALVQALLVRAIVARCWDDPYRHRPTRWGTQLHDKFMLPWFVERDLHDVVDDLRVQGFGLETEWFDPFFEFRFPRLGSTTVADVNMEVRGAIEPWHVLGEEATGSGMARYVDSSVERVQLRVDGLVDDRHVVTCNGAVVPLTATEVPGTYVAGVRYKAWAPPSALHPLIEASAPLTFDVVDRWNRRSLGGCRYHVVHQGGLSYDTFPINAYEAESRRQNRFEEIGHTPGVIDADDHRLQLHPEHPVTLDLRRTGHTDTR